MTNETQPGSAPPHGASNPNSPKAPDALAKDFHDATGTTPTGGRPIIRYMAGELPRLVTEAEDALMHAADHHIFQRAAGLVRVVRQPTISARNFKRPVNVLQIVGVDKAYLTEQIARAAVWERYDGRSESWRAMNPPEQVAQMLLARVGEWKLRRLAGAISTPTLRPDGSVLQDAGYDESTATWFDPCGVEFPRIPDRPTKKQAVAAADTLMMSMQTLPFVDQCDLSVAVSLMLTSLVRRSLPSAPMGAITAPTPGSGKTLIADCISILATGAEAPAMQYAATDEEAEKVALSVLLAGLPLVLIDNIERPLAGAWLCSILTSTSHQGRVLGRNEMVSVPTATMFLATGNRLVIQGDLRTRALLCRIDPKHENPDQRKFEVELREVFARDRVKLVVAALTLMRAYLAGGEGAGVFRTWGRFEQWSKFCREPLMWIGMADPCDSYALIAEDDPERQEHLQVMAAWDDVFQAKPVTAREVIESIMGEHNRSLRDALDTAAKDRGGVLSAKRLAGWLRSRDGRIVSGRMLQKAGETRDHVTLWKLTNVTN